LDKKYRKTPFLHTHNAVQAKKLASDNFVGKIRQAELAT
jgi:hypothetical protein